MQNYIYIYIYIYPTILLISMTWLNLFGSLWTLLGFPLAVLWGPFACLGLLLTHFLGDALWVPFGSPRDPCG